MHTHNTCNIQRSWVSFHNCLSLLLLLFFQSPVFQNCGSALCHRRKTNSYIISQLWNNTCASKFSSVQLLGRIWLFATPWTAARQASLSITNSWSLLKLMSIESVMPSNHLILCCPLLLPPSIFPSIRVFSSESFLHIRRLKYWSFSFNFSPCSEYLRLISFRMDWLDLLAVQETQEFSPTVQFSRSVVCISCISTLNPLLFHAYNNTIGKYFTDKETEA